jgi:hypothetical protein
MIASSLQEKLTRQFQPLPPLGPEIDWDLKTTRLTQSIFVTLSVNEMWLEISKLEPTNSFLLDLKTARSLEYKRLKYEYFNMMVKKYGFLFWQEPSVDTGSFLEIEVDLVFEKALPFKDAIRTLKTMWKNHLWQFLQDFKVYPERRLSVGSLKTLLEDFETEGEGYRFFRKFKGLNGDNPTGLGFDTVFDKMKMPVSAVLVRSNNRFWDYNGCQFVFHYASQDTGLICNESRLANTILQGGSFVTEVNLKGLSITLSIHTF